MTFGKLFFSFNGRINRQRYWLASLGLTLVIMTMQAILMFGIMGALDDTKPAPASAAFGLILVPLYIIFFISSLSIIIKRFHDIDKSGWNILWNFIPIVGPIFVIYWLGFKKGTTGPNRFGDDLLPPPYVMPAQPQNGAVADVVPAVQKPAMRTSTIIIIAFVAVILLGGAFAGLFYGILSFIKGDESYVMSENYIRQSTEVHEAVGDITAFGTMPSGGFSVSNGEGTANYDIKVEGTRGVAYVSLKLSKHPHESWQINDVKLYRKPE